MPPSRRVPVVRGRLLVGGVTAVAVLLLVVAGGVLFVANTEGPRDFTGYPFLLVPFIGTALLTRADLGAGFTAAVLSCALGYILATAIAVVNAVADVS